MLLRLRVTNHASIRGEVELSMVAANDYPDLAIQSVEQLRTKVLPVAAIYGANASGKSNILDGFLFMRTVIYNSHQGWRPEAPIPRRPFKLDRKSKQNPSTFTVDFVLDGERYEYGFSLDDTKVLSEWLYSFPKKRQRLLFERNFDEPIRFGESLDAPRRSIARFMRPNSLYLSTAAANNHAQLTKLYRWFMSGIIPVRAGADLRDSYTLHEWQHHDNGSLRNLLKYADTGVVDLEVEEQEVSEEVALKFQEFLQLYDPEHADDSRFGPPPRIEFAHSSDEDIVRLSMDEESSGTLAWVVLIGPAVAALRRGGFLVVDELDANLHPSLAARLVGMFQDPFTNTRGAQLLFNTHNVTLMSPSAPWRLRRDQVWFTDKDSRTGVTQLIPLTDYRVRDGLENIEKRYLGGRYGAIPFLDDRLLESLLSE